MRKFLAIAVVTAIVATSTPVVAVGDTFAAVELVGTTYTVNLQPLAYAKVQIRNLKTGRAVNSVVSDKQGQFTIPGLPAGDYIVEIVNASGKVLGMTSPFKLGTVATYRLSVVAVSEGVMAEGGRAGVSLFGLGSMASLAVVGATAAGAGAVVGAISTRPDASPSR